MNELLVNRLRSARTDKNMKQQEVADILGIKPNTLSNWEKGRTEPDIDTFVKLCQIYQVDCADLLSDVYAFQRISNDVSLAEYEYIKKYRDLDDHGREMVDFTLNKEYERSKALAEQEKESADNIVDMSSHLDANAAQARTDIDIPEGSDTSENDVMDDKDF